MAGEGGTLECRYEPVLHAMIKEAQAATDLNTDRRKYRPAPSSCMTTTFTFFATARNITNWNFTQADNDWDILWLCKR
jgi:hypothetical protein